MKKVLFGSAFVLAITAVFAFKADTKEVRTMKLANANVYNKLLDPCQTPRLCSDNPTLPACVTSQGSPVTMYDDPGTCKIVSAFQFIPE